MDKEKDIKQTKLIEGKFKQHVGDKTEQTKVNHQQSNQTNPLYNRLFKLTHKDLMKPKGKYKSFTKFKPEDLR